MLQQLEGLNDHPLAVHDRRRNHAGCLQLRHEANRALVTQLQVSLEKSDAGSLVSDDDLDSTPEQGVVAVYAGSDTRFECHGTAAAVACVIKVCVH